MKVGKTVQEGGHATLVLGFGVANMADSYSVKRLSMMRRRSRWENSKALATNYGKGLGAEDSHFCHDS